MRFDKEVYFESVQSVFDENTGNYTDSVTEVKQYASVTDSGTQTMLLVYGKIKQGSLTIRLQNHFNEPFDRIRIGEKHYSVDMMRTLCRMQVFIVSEVQ